MDLPVGNVLSRIHPSSCPRIHDPRSTTFSAHFILAKSFYLQLVPPSHRELPILVTLVISVSLSAEQPFAEQNILFPNLLHTDGLLRAFFFSHQCNVISRCSTVPRYQLSLVWFAMVVMDIRIRKHS